MITYVVGDLFQSPARVLVNAVNTVGVMGKGIAADFKRFYPPMFDQYQALCEQGDFEVGLLMLYKTPHKWVLNFPTKQHWRSHARVDDIGAGLQKFVATYAERGITSVSFPLLGSGLGKLDWEVDVRPLMEAYLGPLPIAVYIHRFDIDDPFAPERRNTRGIGKWLNNPPRTIPFSKLWRDLGRLVTKQKRFFTLDGSDNFRVVFDDGKRRSLTFYPKEGESVFVPETMLVDLWTTIRSAGYCMPHNVPGGLDAHAHVLFSLLAGLDYIKPVLLSWDDDERHIGLHVIPPIDQRADRDARRVTIGNQKQA